jgi:hypothetical protein
MQPTFSPRKRPVIEATDARGLEVDARHSLQHLLPSDKALLDQVDRDLERRLWRALGGSRLGKNSDGRAR